MKKLLLAMIRFYKRAISPYFPARCRFTPTCSAYCIGAVMEWGVVIGLALTLWRVLRCNPFCPGGYDPVPDCPWRKKDKR